MSKNKGIKSSIVTAVSTPTTEATPTPEAPKPTIIARSLSAARDANAGNAPVDITKPERAKLVRPSKGENKERRKVFGYDNGPGGKVPTGAKVVVVNAPGLAASYPALHDAVEATPEADVNTLKSTGVSGKSFRRAFRSGLIRFTQG